MLRDRKGHMLIELLIVVVIISMLAAIVVSQYEGPRLLRQYRQERFA